METVGIIVFQDARGNLSPGPWTVVSPSEAMSASIGVDFTVQVGLLPQLLDDGWPRAKP